MGDNHSVQLDRESGGSLNHLVSTRSQESELSTGEVLRRMREKSEKQKNEIEEMEIEALGAYNAFSRPKSSAVSLIVVSKQKHDLP